MATFWFWAVAAMLAIYASLDGFDIGAGIIHLLVAQTEAERRAVLRSIGPVWDGNEVWLIAGGGVLFMAFPTLYASSFSGFYLPLMIVLWLLIFRGIAIEFRNRIESPVWSPLWDVVFAGASAALALFYGVAIGNVVRGVPLDSSGYFFLPLWTNLLPGKNAGVLDWFTILVGIAGFFAMAHHGAMWVAVKTDGELEARCRRLAAIIWWPVLIFTVLVAIVSPVIQPQLLDRIAHHQWGYVLSAAALTGLLGTRYFNRTASGAGAFGCSCAYMMGIAACTAFGIYPYVLASNLDPKAGLTIFQAAAPPHALEVGLAWFIPGMAIAAIYVFIAYRGFAGKVGIEGGGH
ncbi:MAG TPA: cytochrome d ubiquinol oxidase subunit II [Candidatus Binataceae bacterium]|nr:cytochrome d ubiquinol oxidase subunit II [Candidatus Binataceae bacterium]